MSENNIKKKGRPLKKKINDEKNIDEKNIDEKNIYKSYIDYINDNRINNNNTNKILDKDDKTYVSLYHYYCFYKKK